jgi:hypothetical protein
MRRARTLTLVAAVLMGLAVALPGGASALSRATVVYLYQGSERGQENLYGFVSPFKPYALYGHRAWMWSWTVRCVKTAVLLPNADLGCRGRVSIHGWASDVYLYGLRQDCTADITNIRGASWTIAGRYLGNNKLQVAASGPLAERAIVPNPVSSDCGPNDAVNWLGDINTVGVSPLFNLAAGIGGFDAFDRTVKGTYDHGTADFNSQLFVSLRSFPTVPAALLDQWADQIGFWLTQQQDAQANQSIIRSPLDIQVPVNGSISGQAVPVTGAGGVGAADVPMSSTTVFTIKQRLRAGVLTALQIGLTPYGMSLVDSPNPLPKLDITLKFTPARGRARTVTRRVTPPPPLPPMPAG